jgi:uncharacterized integral membrane protein
MKNRTVFLLFVLAIIAAFAALNWGTFTAPTSLSLGLTEVQAPLGLVMLALLAFLTALFLVFALYLQTSVLFETRRHAKEIHANRELADQAEASRFTELRSFLEAEAQARTGREAESRAALLARLDQLSHDLKSMVEQSGNSIAAHIGELEDRLERGTQVLANPPT